MTFQLLIDIIASIIGVLSIFFLLRLNKKVGGKMSSALRWFIAGIGFMILAFIWSGAFGHGIDVDIPMHITDMVMNSTSAFEPPVDIHQTLMTIGMVFFIFAAHKFSSLVLND